jgi:hypothetical protein
MVDAIESRLTENLWLGGQQPSKEDAEQFAALAGAVPNVDTHPNTFAWYSLVSKFTDAVRGTWTAAAPAQAAGVSIPKRCRASLASRLAERRRGALASTAGFL